MSTFMIVIEDNEQGVNIRAHDMRHPGDKDTLAYNMGCFLVDRLITYMAEQGVDRSIPVQTSRTNH